MKLETIEYKEIRTDFIVNCENSNNIGKCTLNLNLSNKKIRNRTTIRV